MDSSESRSAIVLELAEEFLDRYRRGQRPSLKEYADRHPELAVEIRDVFPAMAMMENVALADESLDGESIAAAPRPGPSPPLERLGDFRILREVGHGGMGIVYEAEQVSLGRHVALKVLPRTMVRDARQLARFEREARSAAKLHHTNIVPVFGVGEQDGTPYYVMQFIAGLGLDAVIEELRQLRAGGIAAPGDPPGIRDREATAAAVAHSLLTGRFEPGGMEGESAGLGLAATLARTGTGPLAATDPGPSGGSGRVIGPDGFLAASSESAVGSSSALLPGRGHDARAGRPRPVTYWQSVARVGVQVAEALDYAHKQGVVHRDVKPSNLLLDARGTVWVTDFGLAKAGDQHDLTHTGDILGTLRYMPPEAFEGKSDARGDIYSLGLTLYEMLAFRPAYEERDRNRLIKRVTSEEPPRLKALNPEVPRDLETIVHKAIDRDPGHRYATPGELASDLQRYLEDEPIRARRITPMEHCARWCRRNRLVASLAASLIGFLVIATVVSLIGLARMRRLAARETAARLVADQQKDAAEQAQMHESQQRRLAEQSRQQAEAALADAKLQRDRAEANFAKARAAVDDYLTKVSESQLLKVPGMQPLRRDLLQSALGFYRDFLKERGNDPSLRIELAATQVRMGRIYTDLGSAVEARTILEAAIAAYQDALSASPKDLEIRAVLADAWQALGDLAYEHGKSPDRGQDMLAAYRKAVEQREAIVRERARDSNDRKDLALAWNRMGIAQGSLGLHAEALDSYRRAAEIRHALIRERPDDPALHYALGESFLNLAAALGRGHSSEAVAMYLRSQEFYRFAYGKFPHMIEYGCDLGSAYLSAGLAYRALGRVDEALSELREGVEHFRRMTRDHPAVPVVQRRLIEALKTLAAAHQAMGQPVEAARALREAGQWIDKQAGDEPDAVFEAARFHARQSIPVTRAGEAPSSEEQVDARREADRAVEQLDRAIAGGFARLDALRNNADLDRLRDREDFQRLVAKLADRLEKPAGTAAPAPMSQAERARQAKADHATTLHAIGLARIGLNRLDEARASLERARSLREELAREAPDDARSQAELASTRIALGKLEWKAGRLAEAARLWRGAEDLQSRTGSRAPASPRDRSGLAEAHLAIGEQYAHYGLWALAAPLTVRAVVEEPGDDGRVSLSGEALGVHEAAALSLAAGDETAYRRVCALILERISAWSPTAAHPAVWTLVLAPGGIGDPARALPLFGAAPLATFWENHAMSLALYRCGRFAEVVRRLHEWDGRRPDHWLATGLDAALLAMALHRLGRGDEARRALEDAEAAQSRTARTIVERGGEIPVPWWDWAGALALRREAQQVVRGKAGPDPPLATLAAARIYANLGRTDLAEAGFRAAVAAAPDDPGVWLARAEVFAELGHRDRADADLARAAALPSADPMPWIHHGRWLAGRGDRAGADAAFARAARLTPHELNRFIEAGWWVVGPYPKGLATPCPPEIDPDPARPVAASDGSAALSWRSVATGEYGRVDLRAVFNADDVSAYALTYVFSPDERTTTLMVGGDDQVRVWLNGRLVHELAQKKTWPWLIDPVPVTLRAGRNTLLVKMNQRTEVHSLILRLADHPIDRGNRLARMGLWRESADQYDRAFRDRLPEDLGAIPEYAALLWASGQVDRCRRLGEAVHERLGPTSEPWGIDRVARTCDFAPGGRIDFARLAGLHEQFAEGKRRTEGLTWDFLNAALTHLRTGQPERALNHIHEFHEKQSGLVPPLLALAYHGLGRANEARQALADADQVWEGTIQSLSAAGGPKAPLAGWWLDFVVLDMLRREARAKIEGTDPGEDMRFRAYQDRMRDWLKHLDKATADYDVELMFEPGQARLWLARGRRLGELGRWSEADADLDKAVELAKGGPRVRAERGRILADRGQPDRAADDFARALELAATASDEVRDAIASDLAARDAVYDPLVRSRPGDRRLQEWRVRHLARRGRWDRAALVAGELCETKVDELIAVSDNRTYDRLARICPLIMADDRDGYRRFIREGLDRDRLSDDAVALVLADGPGILAPDAMDDHDLAIRMAERALKGRFPDQINWPGCALYILGAAHYRAGHYEEAVRCCRRSLEEYPGWTGKVLNWPVLALAYHRLGNAEEAHKALARAWSLAGRTRRGRFDTDLLLEGRYSDMVNWLELIVWLREAEAVILDDPVFPADPFAAGS